MKCTNCNTEFQGTFCPNCGTPYQAISNNLILPEKKRKFKIWQIILISVGGIFALIGLFFSFIVWLSFTFGTTDTQTDTNSQLNAEVKNIYELDIENNLCNITYNTPSEFETIKGTSGEILYHKSPNEEHLMVTYIDLGNSASVYTQSQANEILDAAIEGAKSSGDSFELYNKEYIEIAGCHGIEYSYKREDVYACVYTFLYGDGVYQFSFSSGDPILEDSEVLLSAIVDTVKLQ